MKMKISQVTILAALLVLTLAIIPAGAETIDVHDQDQQLTKSVAFSLGVKEYFIDNKVPGVKMDAAPFIENGRTFVPIRYLSNALGVTNENILWDSPLVRLTEPGFPLVELAVGVKQIKTDGKTKSIDTSPLLKSGRTYLPARFVAEALGYQVDWDATNQIVICWPAGADKPNINAVVSHIKQVKPAPAPASTPAPSTGSGGLTAREQAALDELMNEKPTKTQEEMDRFAENAFKPFDPI